MTSLIKLTSYVFSIMFLFLHPVSLSPSQLLSMPLLSTFLLQNGCLCLPFSFPSVLFLC